MAATTSTVTIGVLALQGAFSEHIQLLRKAFEVLETAHGRRTEWSCVEVRTPQQLDEIDALIIPGGERLYKFHTTYARVQRKLTWGTCAGMILLAEAANRTKQNGQELIGGLDVRVNRNHFGRQVESFETYIKLPFLSDGEAIDVTETSKPFKGVFIRAPIVEKILPLKTGTRDDEAVNPDVVVAPSKTPDRRVPFWKVNSNVEILATLPNKGRLEKDAINVELVHEEDIIAVRQGNVLATSFHPELTDDARIHVWWLRQVWEAVSRDAT